MGQKNRGSTKRPSGSWPWAGRGRLGLSLTLGCLAMFFLPHARSTASPPGPAGPGFHPAETIDARFIQGLSDRHLDTLVDAYGRQRWDDPDLTERQRVDLTVAWIRAITGRALASAPGRRSTHWQHAAKLAAAFQQRAASAPRGLLVSLQLALAQVAQGELAMQAPKPAREPTHSANLETRDALRAALAQFERIDSQIDARLAGAYQSAPGKPDAWTSTELESLRRNVSLQTARALRLQAVSYPADSPDRINSLDRALKHLQNLTAMQKTSPVLWPARLETLFCLRTLGQWDRADHLLTAWETDSPPSIQLPLTAERLALLRAQGQLEKALTKAQALLQQPTDTRSADVDFAILEVLLVARDKLPLHGNDYQASASMLTEQATELARQLGDRYGPSWRQRALVRLGQALATEVENATVLGHAANALMAAGNLAAALATYDRAAKLARAKGKQKDAFGWSLAAAAVANRLHGPQAALPRYRQLALSRSQQSGPQQSAAANTHLIAMGLAAALARQADPGSPRREALKNYENLLLEHLQSWPKAPSASTARWWLARLRIGQQRWLEAASLLGEIPPASEYYEQAVHASLACYQHGLPPLATASEPDSNGPNSNGPPTAEISARPTRRQVLELATRQWQKVITGTDNRWPSQWTSLQRTVALALARLQLVESAEGHRYVEKLLTAALTSYPQTSQHKPSEKTWKPQAMTLLAAAKVRAGKLAEAEGLLQELKTLIPLDAETALTFVRSLRIQQEPDRQRRQTLARFVLQILALVATGENGTGENGVGDSKQLAELARAGGSAHELLGERMPALAAYRQWMQQRPEDGAAQEACAALLGKGLDPKATLEPESQSGQLDPAQARADGQQALRLWQQIERRSKPGGPRWRRARQARIGLLEQLGHHEQSQKLQQLTRILYP